MNYGEQGSVRSALTVDVVSAASSQSTSFSETRRRTAIRRLARHVSTHWTVAVGSSADARVRSLSARMPQLWPCCLATPCASSGAPEQHPYARGQDWLPRPGCVAPLRRWRPGRRCQGSPTRAQWPVARIALGPLPRKRVVSMRRWRSWFLPRVGMQDSRSPPAQTRDKRSAAQGLANVAALRVQIWRKCCRTILVGTMTGWGTGARTRQLPAMMRLCEMGTEFCEY